MDDEMLSPLEQELLDEYSNLLRNMNRLNEALHHLATSPVTTTATLEALRTLERKTTVVCTLLKASVYSIVLQQEVYSHSSHEDTGGAASAGASASATGEDGRI